MEEAADIVRAAGHRSGAPVAILMTSTAASSAISIRDLGKSFGGVRAVAGISLEIGRGEFFSLLGPSGCGKTTLMRLIAGFETPDAGSIAIDGQPMAGVPPHQRPVNMMFQSYALFPHLTVAGNIAFGLKRQGLAREPLQRRVAEMLALVQLEALADRKPHQLSGGQRQRVALARALARDPKVLLLDEPLGALDKKLRKETQAELKRIQAASGATFVVVTHDQEEAMALSDRIAIMREGRIVQVGAPEAVYDQPASIYVAGFVGEVNLLPAVPRRMPDGHPAIAIEGVVGLVPVPDAPVADRLTVALRPEHLRLGPREDVAEPGLAVTVEDAAHLGPVIAYRLRTVDGRVLSATVQSGQGRLKPGEAAWAGFDPGALRLLVE